MPAPRSSRRSPAASLKPKDGKPDSALPQGRGDADSCTQASGSEGEAAGAAPKGTTGGNSRAVTDAQLELMILQLTTARGSGKTCCPSEVPRRLLGERGAWRELMGRTRAVAVRLARELRVEITQRGQVVRVEGVGELRGPIRLRAPTAKGGGSGGVVKEGGESGTR